MTDRQQCTNPAMHGPHVYEVEARLYTCLGVMDYANLPEPMRPVVEAAIEFNRVLTEHGSPDIVSVYLNQQGQVYEVAIQPAFYLQSRGHQ